EHRPHPETTFYKKLDHACPPLDAVSAARLYKRTGRPNVTNKRPPLTTDDDSLVTALRRREPAAFDELYRRYRDRIWGFLIRLTGDRSDAEDLFQETWLAAAAHAHRLTERSELLPWLFTIARNKHRSLRRFVIFDRRRKDLFLSEADFGTSRGPD